ncbi:hypothetical protein F443_19663 [Phytophthora nicotianae P1569]|uniref:Uncharacterized protein n=1 Tax=Phytophthora nicotianae P1569 TaxID=1317065 RepID=V9E3Z9_PHYNI|nr:hypothetical protein F443_19663 [Phytophthora nicotianae P1569]
MIRWTHNLCGPENCHVKRLQEKVDKRDDRSKLGVPTTSCCAQESLKF